MREAIEIYDLSPEISSDLAVFPGDQAFERQVAMDFRTGHNLVLSALRTTVHLGAHADAPNHYHPEGEGISSRDLKPYFGECQVVRVELERGARIRPEHVRTAISARRVLLKTGSFPDPNRWNGDFNSLSPELVDWLADRGVVLVGIDTPSVDPEKDARLESHQAIFRRDLSILEGLVLDRVPEGTYTLMALPLRLKDLDASPVRAVLVRGGGPWK
jgi:arylformamidase